jgi:site-specific recombinase XerD
MKNNPLVPVAPLELLQSPESLSGANGTNRAPAFITQQISAVNDLQAIQCWLAEFIHSPQTLRAYRKESERLLLWTLSEKQKPFSSLTRDDLRDYQLFLANPQPSDRWCGSRKPRHDMNWRPFEGPLSPKSIGQSITVINALFSYLVEAGYLSGNPLGLMRRKAQSTLNQPTKITERFLEQNLWQVVVDYIEALPQITPRDKKEYERTRFIFHLLYLLGPRVSEVANSMMRDIKQIRGKWWWQVTGKGQKTQIIPVTAPMLQSLMRYRQFYNLPQLPIPDENHSLFMSLNGTKKVSANMIYRLVKKTFLDCAKIIGKDRPDFALKLKQASTHWMRHTSITHQADAGIELRYIQRHARHANVETTMLYQHAEEDQWHDSMALHKIVKK